MMQEVNLLVPELRPAPERLALGQVGAVWCGLAALLLAISSWQGIGVWRLASEKADKQARADVLSAANDSLRSSFSTTPEPQLVARVKQLRETLQNQALMVKAVKAYQGGSGRGFASYLEDLAAHRVDGMTLSRIELTDGGNRIQLSGETVAPVNVPVFLERLSDGDSFRGHRFDEFRLEAQESGLLHFDITGPAEKSHG